MSRCFKDRSLYGRFNAVGDNIGECSVIKDIYGTSDYIIVHKNGNEIYKGYTLRKGEGGNCTCKINNDGTITCLLDSEIYSGVERLLLFEKIEDFFD